LEACPAVAVLQQEQDMQATAYHPAVLRFFGFEGAVEKLLCPGAS